MKRRTLAALMMAALTACEPIDGTGIDGVDGFRDGGADAGEDDSDLAQPYLAPARAFAVRSSDYSATSIGLISPDGEVLMQEFLHSGSAPTGLATALSGDVALPTRSGDRDHLTTLDRLRTDVLTRLDVQSGEVLGQLKTHTPAGEGEESFSSNPQDYVYLDDEHAWITRFGVDPRASREDIDRGSDLLRVHPTAMSRMDDRIDLSRFDDEGSVENPDTGEEEEVAIYARPQRMVRVGDHHVVVGLARLSLGYDAIAPGMVALVDLESRRAEGFSLDGLENCGEVTPIPGDASRVVVACVGFFRGEPREGAGIVTLAFDGEELAVEQRWEAKDDPDDPIAVYGLTALSDRVVVAAAAGKRDSEQPEDRLYRIDLESGELSLVFEAASSYAIGDGAYSERDGLLFVPDGSTDDSDKPIGGVRVFEVDGDLMLEERDLVRLDDVLPARQVKPL